SVRALRPTDRCQCAGHRPRRAVRIAVAETAAERIGHLAARIEQIERIRNLQAVLERLLDLAARITLAAHLAAQIDEDAVDELHLRVLGKKRFKLGLCGCKSHRFIPFCGTRNAHGTPLSDGVEEPSYCNPA